MLNEHAEEALNAAEERAMYHYRLVRCTVFADVLEIETGGEVPVKLNSRQLPEAA